MNPLLMLLGCLFFTQVSAQHVELKSITIEQKNQHWIIGPHYDISLSEAIVEAIHNGIEITFVSEIRLIDEKSWWPDQTVEHQTKRFEIHYFSLSSQYQLKHLETANTSSFVTLDNLLTQLTQKTAFKMAQNPKASSVEAEFYLDHRALPSTMQLPILWDKQWSLQSQTVLKSLPNIGSP